MFPFLFPLQPRRAVDAGVADAALSDRPSNDAGPSDASRAADASVAQNPSDAAVAEIRLPEIPERLPNGCLPSHPRVYQELAPQDDIYRDYCVDAANQVMVPRQRPDGSFSVISYRNNYSGLLPLPLHSGFLLGDQAFSEGQYRLLTRLFGTENIRLVQDYQGPGRLLLSYDFFEPNRADAYENRVNAFHNYIRHGRLPQRCNLLPFSGTPPLNDCEALSAAQITAIQTALARGYARTHPSPTSSRLNFPIPAAGRNAAVVSVEPESEHPIRDGLLYLGGALAVSWAFARAVNPLIAGSAKAVGDAMMEAAWLVKNWSYTYSAAKIYCHAFWRAMNRTSGAADVASNVASKIVEKLRQVYWQQNIKVRPGGFLPSPASARAWFSPRLLLGVAALGFSAWYYCDSRGIRLKDLPRHLFRP